ARPPQCRARLVAEARSRGPGGHHQLESARPQRRAHLACHGTRDRPHPSIARACGESGLADRRRRYLWHAGKFTPPAQRKLYSAFRRAAPASAFTRDRDSDLEKQGATACDGARTGAHPRPPQRVRVGRAMTAPSSTRGEGSHTVNLALSWPLIASLRTVPGASRAIATGTKCSVRPCVALSISTSRVAPTSEASRPCNAASPALRRRFAR